MTVSPLMFLLWLYVLGLIIFAITGALIHGDMQRLEDRQERAVYNNWLHQLNLNHVTFSLFFGVMWPVIAVMTLKKGVRTLLGK